MASEIVRELVGDDWVTKVGTGGGGPSGPVTAGDIDSEAAANGEVLTADGAGAAAWVAPGGSQPGVIQVRTFAFAFDTAGLTAGVTIWTPAANELLLDSWFEPTTQWNNTANANMGLIDAGAWVDGEGLFTHLSVGFVPLSDLTPAADVPLTGFFSFARAGGGAFTPTLATQVLTQNLTSNFFPSVPVRFLISAPVKLIVTKDDPCVPGGLASEATAGAATLYIVTCTPAAV